MTIRTQLKAGRIVNNHNEALQVRTALKAGGTPRPQHSETLQVRSGLKAGIMQNHNETLKVRSGLRVGRVAYNHNETLHVRSALRAGRIFTNHNETLRREAEQRAISMRKQVRATGSQLERLELLVVRAGLRAGARDGRAARKRSF
jgi:hypothetical protein